MTSILFAGKFSCTLIVHLQSEPFLYCRLTRIFMTAPTKHSVPASPGFFLPQAATATRTTRSSSSIALLPVAVLFSWITTQYGLRRTCTHPRRLPTLETQTPLPRLPTSRRALVIAAGAMTTTRTVMAAAEATVTATVIPTSVPSPEASSVALPVSLSSAQPSSSSFVAAATTARTVLLPLPPLPKCRNTGPFLPVPVGQPHPAPAAPCTRPACLQTSKATLLKASTTPTRPLTTTTARTTSSRASPTVLTERRLLDTVQGHRPTTRNSSSSLLEHTEERTTTTSLHRWDLRRRRPAQHLVLVWAVFQQGARDMIIPTDIRRASFLQ